MKLIAAVCLSLLAVGCATQRPIKAAMFEPPPSNDAKLLDVPKQCYHVTLTSFSKPCRTISDTTAICDGVVIHPSCTTVHSPRNTGETN